MARHQRHVREVRHVPGADDDPPAVWVFVDETNGFRDLIVLNAIGSDPAAPLLAVDRAKVAVLIGPLVPNPHAVLLQIAHVGVAFQEPKQLVDHGGDVNALRGDQGEAFAEVEPHLVTEDAQVPVPVRSPFGTPSSSTRCSRSR